jgi:hypothetical protein
MATKRGEVSSSSARAFPSSVDRLPFVMKIAEKFVICQDAEAALFPGVTRAANGDLLVSFCTRFDCLPGGRGYLLRSSDEGLTWSEPELVVSSHKPDGCVNLSVGLTTLRDGTILYPCCDARITRKWDQHEVDLVILRSDDHGKSWSEAMPISVGVKEPFAYGRILELRGGDLLCPIWGKHTAEEPWRSGVIRSGDGGLTWGEYRTIAYDPKAAPPVGGDARETHCAGFNETTLLEMPDGRVLAVLRQQGVRGGLRELYSSISTDCGWTWRSPKQLPLWGTSPSLHRQASGVIMLGYRNHRGNPQGLSQPGVGVSFSLDGGESWGNHLLLEDPRGYRYHNESEAGYPAFLTLQDGSVFVVFYSYDQSQQERYLAANILS